jgi:ribulose-phosphate 3-epimerase
VGDYVDAGAFNVTFHVEATDDPKGVADLLHARGCKAGISIKPGTPVEPYLALLDHVDLVLVMSVEPGFGGQSFMPEVLDKVRTLRAEIDRRGLDVLIQIDGGIDARTIGESAAAGCDVFVAGSAVYGAPDPDAMIETLRAGAADARV